MTSQKVADSMSEKPESDQGYDEEAEELANEPEEEQKALRLKMKRLNRISTHSHNVGFFKNRAEDFPRRNQEAEHMEYLQKHKILDCYIDVLSEVLETRPRNPWLMIQKRFFDYAQKKKAQLDSMNRLPMREERIRLLFSNLDDGSGSVAIKDVIAFGNILFGDDGGKEPDSAPVEGQHRLQLKEVIRFFAQGTTETLTDDEFCTIFDKAFSQFANAN